MKSNVNNEHIRIGLFGVSRSGKNYTIDDFIELANKNGVKYVHLSPMDMIRARLEGRRLRDMSENEKRALVKEVRCEIDKVAIFDNIIVDEHFCYPETFGGMKIENGYYDEKLPHDILHDSRYIVDYEVVFPRFESMKYDLLAVMNIDPSIIVQRSRTSEGAKYNPHVTTEEIEDWQRAEADGLRAECHVPMVFITDPKISGAQLWDSVNRFMTKRRVENGS